MDFVTPLQITLEGPISSQGAMRVQQTPADAQETQNKKKAEQYWKVAEGFEEMFLNMMLKSMRQTTMQSDFLDSHSMRIYRSMFDQELAATMSQRHSFGISKMVYDWLTRTQPELQEYATPVQEAVRSYQAIEAIVDRESQGNVLLNE